MRLVSVGWWMVWFRGRCGVVYYFRYGARGQELLGVRCCCCSVLLLFAAAEGMPVSPGVISHDLGQAYEGGASTTRTAGRQRTVTHHYRDQASNFQPDSQICWLRLRYRTESGIP